jgi:predicted membrane protein
MTFPPNPSMQVPPPRRGGFQFSARAVFGLVVVSMGVLFLLDNLGILNAYDWWRYWPIALILIGLGKLPAARTTPDRLGAAMWLLAGIVLLAHTQDWFDFDLWELWPIFLILVGIRLIWGARGRSHAVAATPIPGDMNSYFKGFAFMSGWERRVTSQQFTGGEASAVMGGGEIDLREARIATSPAVIDVFAMWGGIDIRVPGDWTVVNEVQAILGGVEDSRKERGNDPSKQLIVKGFVVMGGIEIKN